MVFTCNPNCASHQDTQYLQRMCETSKLITSTKLTIHVEHLEHFLLLATQRPLHTRSRPVEPLESPPDQVLQNQGRHFVEFRKTHFPKLEGVILVPRVQ